MNQILVVRRFTKPYKYGEPGFNQEDDPEELSVGAAQDELEKQKLRNQMLKKGVIKPHTQMQKKKLML